MRLKNVTRDALLLGLLCCCGIPRAVAVPTLSLAPASSVVLSGHSFTLDVAIANVTDLFSFQFDLAFHPGVLAATSITESPFLPGGGATVCLPGVIDNAGGTITFTADSLLGGWVRR